MITPRTFLGVKLNRSYFTWWIVKFSLCSAGCPEALWLLRGTSATAAVQVYILCIDGVPHRGYLPKKPIADDIFLLMARAITSRESLFNSVVCVRILVMVLPKDQRWVRSFLSFLNLHEFFSTPSLSVVGKCNVERKKKYTGIKTIS